MDQSNLLENMVEFNDKSRPRKKKNKEKKKKWNPFERVNALYEGRQLTPNVFRSRIFSVNTTQGRGLKILTLKQMHQRVPIALAHVKAGNACEELLTEIRQVIYSLYQEKEITKKVYNNIMNSVKIYYKNGYYIYEF